MKFVASKGPAGLQAEFCNKKLDPPGIKGYLDKYFWNIQACPPQKENLSFRPQLRDSKSKLDIKTENIPYQHLEL